MTSEYFLEYIFHFQFVTGTILAHEDQPYSPRECHVYAFIAADNCNFTHECLPEATKRYIL